MISNDALSRFGFLILTERCMELINTLFHDDRWFCYNVALELIFYDFDPEWSLFDRYHEHEA